MIYDEPPARRAGETEIPSLWPAVLGLSSAAAWTVVTEPGLAAVRPVIVLWFLLVCPGMAFARLMRLQSAVATWTLTIALSLTIDAIVALGLLYTGTWSAIRGLVLLIGFTLAAAALQALRDRQAVGRAPALAGGAGGDAAARKAWRIWAGERPRYARIARLAVILALLVPLVGAMLYTGLRGDEVMSIAPATVSQSPGGHAAASVDVTWHSIIQALAGSQSPLIGVVIAVILAALLVQREVDRVAGQPRRRDIVISLLLVAYLVIIALRFARLARIL